jgi:hypothetical protein
MFAAGKVSPTVSSIGQSTDRFSDCCGKGQVRTGSADRFDLVFRPFCYGRTVLAAVSTRKTMTLPESIGQSCWGPNSLNQSLPDQRATGLAKKQYRAGGPTVDKGRRACLRSCRYIHGTYEVLAHAVWGAVRPLARHSEISHSSIRRSPENLP